jgi:hypothetical protein
MKIKTTWHLQDPGILKLQNLLVGKHFHVHDFVISYWNQPVKFFKTSAIINGTKSIYIPHNIDMRYYVGHMYFITYSLGVDGYGSKLVAIP